MNKKRFLTALKKRLYKLPYREIRERINFYSEIIDDRIEEGLTEEEAVADVGSVEEIAKQILSDENYNGDIKTRKKAVSPWQIVLLIVGSPVWLPILIAIFVVIWSIVISLWAVEIPFFIIGFISKYLLIVCIAIGKFTAIVTKKCFEGIGRLFSA